MKWLKTAEFLHELEEQSQKMIALKKFWPSNIPRCPKTGHEIIAQTLRMAAALDLQQTQEKIEDQISIIIDLKDI